MTDEWLLYAAMVVFSLLFLGIILTILEFHYHIHPEIKKRIRRSKSNKKSGVKLANKKVTAKPKSTKKTKK